MFVISVSIIHLPKLGTPVHIIRVFEAFKERNFTHFFLIYDVYVKIVTSLNK